MSNYTSLYKSPYQTSYGTGAASAPTLADNLAAYFSWDSAATTDSTGNVTASIEAGTLSAATGIVAPTTNGAASSTSGTGRVQVTHTQLPLDDNSWTISAWAKRDFSTGQRHVMGQASSAGGSGRSVTTWYLGTNIDGGAPARFEIVNTANGVCGQCTDSGATWNNTSWHHFFISFNRDTAEMLLKQDGRTAITATANTGTPKTSAHSLKLFDSHAYYLLGSMDETAIWNGVVLDPSVGDWLYNSGSGRTYSEVIAYEL